MIIYGLVFCKGFVLQGQALKKTSFNDSANFIQKSRDVFPPQKVYVCKCMSDIQTFFKKI